VVGNFNDVYDRGPFRWTAEEGFVQLADSLFGIPAAAAGVSPDGTIVVGHTSDDEAVMWDKVGIRGLGVLPEASFFSSRALRRVEYIGRRLLERSQRLRSGSLDRFNR
jgi:hypothetical protein